MNYSRFLFSLIFVAAFSANAAPRVSSTFGFESILSEREDEESISNLSINLSDDYSTSDLLLQYDIDSTYVYEYHEDEENTQIEGLFRSLVDLTGSIVWSLDLEFDEIALPGSNEVSQTDSQTVATFTTGIAGSHDIFSRGNLNYGVFSQEERFDESELENEVLTYYLGYLYRFNTTSNIHLNYKSTDVEYLEASESGNDSEIAAISLGVFKQYNDLDFTIDLHRYKVKAPAQDDTASLDGYTIESIYRATSSSNFTFSFGKELRAGASSGSLLNDPQNPFLQAGSFETNFYSLEYDLSFGQNTLTIAVYENEVENVFIDSDPATLNGTSLELRTDINPSTEAFINYRNHENDSIDNEFELVTLRVDYYIARTRPFTFLLSGVSESGTEFDESIDDNLIFIRLNRELF